MKKPPILLIDVSTICYQCMYRVPLASLKEDYRLGVVLQFMLRLLSLSKRFKTNRLVFIFDGCKAVEHRRKVYPTYKQGREENKAAADQQEKDRLAGMRLAMLDLRRKVLPTMGFSNVLCFDKFEGDDIMAEIVKENPNEELIMVTRDNDMLQCLRSPRDAIIENSQFLMYQPCSMFDPVEKELYTSEHFRTEYRIHPKDWSHVKAWAGCHSDGVKGIGKVGIVTAIKFLKRELPEDQEAKFKTDRAQEIYKTNLLVVKLPYTDTPRTPLQEDEFTQEGFGEACDMSMLANFKVEPKLSEWRNFFRGEFHHPNMTKHAEYNFRKINEERKRAKNANG